MDSRVYFEFQNEHLVVEVMRLLKLKVITSSSPQLTRNLQQLAILKEQLHSKQSLLMHTDTITTYPFISKLLESIKQLFLVISKSFLLMHTVTILKKKPTSMTYHTDMNLVTILSRLKGKVTIHGSLFLSELLVVSTLCTPISASIDVKLGKFSIIKDSQLCSSKMPSRQTEDEVSQTAI